MILLAYKDGKIACSIPLHRRIVYFEICMLNHLINTDGVNCAWYDHEAHDCKPECVCYFTHALSMV